MRVLHVNKFAEVVGGVETHLHSLAALQQRAGHSVEIFSASDVPGPGFSASAHGIRDRAHAAAHMLWSRRTARALSERIETYAPDVVHFHGIYHQLSPSVLWAARRSSAATVLTLHDYKLIAPCYLLFRDGAECTDCVGRPYPAPCIANRCVVGSRSASSLCAIEQVLHRPIYRRYVDRYIVPSRCVFAAATDAGVADPARMRVVPHGVSLPSLGSKTAGKVVFAGRLAPEKGILELLTAWGMSSLPDPWTLEIAGDGALARAVRELGVPNAQFSGHLDAAATERTISEAEVAVVPSLFPETFGLSAAEAMAAACCVIASDRGNLPDLVGDAGLVVPAGSTEHWVSALRRVAENPVLRRELGQRARTKITGAYSLEAMVRATRDVYAEAVRLRASASGWVETETA